MAYEYKNKKHGDRGLTLLCNGVEVQKNDPRIGVMGDLDELVSALGVARTFCHQAESIAYIDNIQKNILSLATGIALCTDNDCVIHLTEEDIRYLENGIQDITEDKKYTSFVITGTCNKHAPAFIDLARAICRRAERHIIGLPYSHVKLNGILTAWINRLSSFLWHLARYEETCD